jgi:hypothetical protein
VSTNSEVIGGGIIGNTLSGQKLVPKVDMSGLKIMGDGFVVGSFQVWLEVSYQIRGTLKFQNGTTIERKSAVEFRIDNAQQWFINATFSASNVTHISRRSVFSSSSSTLSSRSGQSIIEIVEEETNFPLTVNQTLSQVLDFVNNVVSCYGKRYCISIRWQILLHCN